MILSKRETFPVDVRLKKQEDLQIKVEFEFKNGINITLPFPASSEENEYESMFKIIEPENNQVEICFFKQRRTVAEVLKKLKIYTHEGTFLRVAFNSQVQRDSFLISLLSEVGFTFARTKPFEPISPIEKTPSSTTMPLLP